MFLSKQDESVQAVDGRDRSTSESGAHEIMEVMQINDKKKDLAFKKLQVIEEKLLRDRSPEARAGRRRMMYRAVYGEFMCTLLFYAPIFCCIANGTISGWTSSFTALVAAFVSGFQAIAVCFAFSSVSGAQFNSAISFALWMTGKLSNRRVVLYIAVQLLASVIGMVVVTCIFHGDLQHVYDSIAVVPADDKHLGKVFATEVFLTFFLTYVAFTVAFEDAESQKKESMSFKTISDSKGLTLYATTPQSKTGFAPFSIGLTIFSLNLLGGSSGGAFNPGRLFGPALFSGRWDYIYVYWFGQLIGAAAAGLLVNNIHRIGIQPTRLDEDTSAREFVEKSLPIGLSAVTSAPLGAVEAEENKNPLNATVQV